LRRVDPSKLATTNDPAEPIQRFTSRRLTRKEKSVKQEIDSYRVNDVERSEVIYFGSQALSVFQSVDLPDAVCDGLTYKQRLIRTDDGHCMLIARWKPDRQMRRSLPDWSQKWFVEKQLFPPDAAEFFARHERRAQAAQASGGDGEQNSGEDEKEEG